MMLSTKEKIELMNSEFPTNDFFSIWTQKEAIAKANGKGLSTSFADIILSENYGIIENHRWNLKRLIIDENYSSFLAFSGEHKVEIFDLTIKDLTSIQKNLTSVAPTNFNNSI